MTVFAQANIRKKVEEMDLKPSEVQVLFSEVNGELTLDELIAKFKELREKTKGAARVVAFLEKAFEDADADGSGSLDFEEWA